MDLFETVSWTGLVYGFVILLMIFGLIVMWVWPRHRDGKMYSMEEFHEFIEHWPKSPDEDRSRAKKTLLMAVLIIITFAAALTKHKSRDRTLDHD